MKTYIKLTLGIILISIIIPCKGTAQKKIETDLTEFKFKKQPALSSLFSLSKG